MFETMLRRLNIVVTSLAMRVGIVSSRCTRGVRRASKKLSTLFDLYRTLCSRFARKRDEHRIGTLTDHRGGNLVPIGQKTIGKLRRDFELEWSIILGFVAPEREECRLACAPAASANARRTSRRIGFACAAAPG
jgi:hypothetical protein